MRSGLVRSAEKDFVAASHEDPRAPGALKKVLLEKLDLPAGRVQMFNLAKVPGGRQFAAHYHEDMTEVFFIISGKAVMRLAEIDTALQPGDIFVVPAGQVHSMRAEKTSDVDYIVFGISSEKGGKTVNV